MPISKTHISKKSAVVLRVRPEGRSRQSRNVCILSGCCYTRYKHRLREYYEGCGYCGARFSRSSSSHRGTGTGRGRRIDCASISATRLAARKRPHRPRAHGNRKSSQVAGRSASASAESANAAAARTSKSSILFEPSTHFRSGSVAPPEVWPKSLCRFAPAARVYVVHLAATSVEFAPVRRACGAWRPSRVGHESYRSAAALAALALKAVLQYCTWKCPL